MIVVYKFAVGDVVQLKSGGPVMTVERNEHTKQVTCVWFEGHTKRTEYFHEDMLTKVNNSPSNAGIFVVR